jgi:hypothetical protein
MPAPLLFFSSLLFSLYSCGDSPSTAAQKELPELTEVVQQLRDDKNHVFLRTLWPDRKECSEFLNSEAAVEMLDFYARDKFKDIDRISENALKPLSLEATVNLLSATKEELLEGKTNGLPEEYILMARHLKDGTTVYGFEYISAEGKLEKTYTAFFQASGRWVFLPRPFLAFQ